MALGAEFALDAIPGLAEAGHTFCTLDGATRLRDALARFRGGRIVVLTAAPAYKCPAAPYEAAMLIESECRRRGTRPAVELALFSAEPGPIGVAGPEVSAAVRGMLSRVFGVGDRPLVERVSVRVTVNAPVDDARLGWAQAARESCPFAFTVANAVPRETRVERA